jgi:hypothetical protein
MRPQLPEILSKVINPKGSPEAEEAIRLALLRYCDPQRKWQDTNYLWLGIREHHRLLGIHPVRDAMTAWLYHAYEPNDELTSAVAFLRDSRLLGYTYDEAEDFVIPLIRNSHPSMPSSSVVGDMRLAIFGQSRIKYLTYSRKIRQAWKFLDKEAWKLGRIAALKALLERPKLYFREEFEKELAGKARENALAEMTLLGWEPPPPQPPQPPAEGIPDAIPLKIRWIPMSELMAAQKEKEDGKKDVQQERPDAPNASTEGSPPQPLPGGSGS